MISQKSICSLLDHEPVVSRRKDATRRHPIQNECEDFIISGLSSYKGQRNNIALGSLDFKCVPSHLIASAAKQFPRVGDVCVRVLPLISDSEEYSSIVDLFNTYIARGASLIATTCISKYTGNEELYIPAVPIHVFVSEWNKSLRRFRDAISSDDGWYNNRRDRLRVISNVTEMTLKNVPVRSEHLWFVMHCIVARPSLVKQVIQLVGSIASMSGTVYHTGEVERSRVPGNNSAHPMKLYLIAKSKPSTETDATAHEENTGVTLGLIWAADEVELYDHLQSSLDCYYVHIGTEAGNTFRCNGFCDWHYYNHKVFKRMEVIGEEMASKFQSTTLAGCTGDSARLIRPV